jgi:hypothetical protein
LRRKRPAPSFHRVRTKMKNKPEIRYGSNSRLYVTPTRVEIGHKGFP